MKTKSSLPAIVWLMVIILASSCSQDVEISQNVARMKGRWQLYYMPGYSMPFEVMFANKKPVIEIDPAKGRYKGQVICNDISGKIEFPDSAHVRFTEPKATAYPCKGFAEPSFIDALKVTEYFHWQHPDTIWLYRKNMLVMKLARLKESSGSSE